MKEKAQKAHKEKRDLFAKLYKTKACNISITADAIGINRRTFYKWKDKYPEFAQQIEEAEDALIDMAETQLYKNAKNGKETSLIFLLTNKRPESWRDRRALVNNKIVNSNVNKSNDTSDFDERERKSKEELKRLFPRR